MAAGQQTEHEAAAAEGKVNSNEAGQAGELCVKCQKKNSILKKVAVNKRTPQDDNGDDDDVAGREMCASRRLVPRDIQPRPMRRMSVCWFVALAAGSRLLKCNQ